VVGIDLPVITVLASMVVSLVQIAGIREDMRELRREMNTKMDMLTGKVYELMAEKH
jgi:hypothetical protein